MINSMLIADLSGERFDSCEDKAERVRESMKKNLLALSTISLSIFILPNIINTTLLSISMIVSISIMTNIGLIISNDVSLSIIKISLSMVNTWLLPNKADSGSSSLSELQTHLRYDDDPHDGYDDVDDEGHLVWYGKLSRMAIHFCRSITRETAFP